ncbi:hypothetical protein ACFOUP_05560 [Belliella kenyensis]|uniref:Secreted protein n=1 Tax=Belliella kenyensis TaxID=1472724 RepID=A0ABV8EJ39_9BACT|nr:hypothetical protein [Belliella kenyensis]MCH7402761.1 hypothetical protein [Belliella kenyensis]MDN3603691.1 hypothetical protein [Belliella kenyensis]
MKFIIPSLLIAIFVSNITFAQVSSGLDSQYNLDQLGGAGNIIREMKPIKESTKGSPLIFEENKNGSIYRNGKIIDSAEYNIDAEEKLILKNSNKGLRYLDKLEFDSLVFNDSDTFINRDVKTDKNEWYLEKIRLNDGQVIFLTHDVILLKGNVGGAYSGGNNYDEYIKKVKLFQSNDDNLEEFKMNKKWLKNNYGKYADIQKELDSNQLKFNSYESLMDLISIVKM